MALYIDSAFLDDITTVAQSLPIAGVTTNPTLLLAAWQQGQHLKAQAFLESVLGMEVFQGTIFMQPGMQREEDTYQEAMEYIGLAPERVIPKIPLTQMGVAVATRIKREGCRIAFTAVTTVAQASIAAMVEADFIIPYYNRLQRSGIDASERVSCMAKVLQSQGSGKGTRILAASIKSAQEATKALLAGAHDLTVPRQIVREMIFDPDTEDALNRFELDWQKMKTL